ncbi:lipopolysaccharide biosynthesis protein [Aliivibrio salmonicida]|uniref:Lipopolysaccharide biosynthesis protein n=1 Tax=Aliivibrio salmonicida (strain LFI1238) TaxID=316275 RepID=B6EHD7_ALISL|nr:hypothetical protein [Aliivibrio salmonicida]AZL83579.1 lipopolysaccharide biosynthesis protein [Aliivibrio salmonicida]AZL86092.1 lipopolysaccharide biosynthesis protein [Aliivibrio salmonicida]CAQ80714.1 putative lipopolysaccharide biosynthesis protein [Aliivibrio salmonicida LFI1238]
MLKNKKILFIAPSFFGYEKDITDELIALGVDVDYFDERPFTSSIAKILNRLNFKTLIKSDIEKHFTQICYKATEKKYDYLFVISPETLEQKFIENIQSANESMISILYMWDSFKNKSNAKKVVSCFDRVFSFDPTDRISGVDIRFLALFYNNNFKSIERDKLVTTQYAVSFIGTVHSDRVKLAKSIMKQFKDRGFNTFSFFYCSSKLLFILKKMFTREFDFISYNEVSFSSMSKLEIKNVFINSSAVIDIQHPDQTGLTMRSIEMLGLNKKLIMTNADIKNYAFYSESNVLVIDRDAPVISERFMSSIYLKPEQEIYDKYSLQSWICTLFDAD